MAVKVRTDITNTPEHDFIGGFDLEYAERAVPDGLFLLLQLLCSDDNHVENDDASSPEDKIFPHQTAKHCSGHCLPCYW